MVDPDFRNGLNTQQELSDEGWQIKTNGNIWNTYTESRMPISTY